MFPAELSLLPTSVALAEFIIDNGWGGIYPYWYLGAPLRYLTGAIFPGLLIGFNQVFPVSLLQVSTGIMIVGIVLGAIGVGVLVKRLVSSFKASIMAALLFVVNPWVWFSTLGLSEGAAGFGSLTIGWWLTGLLILYVRTDYGYKERLLGSILVGLALLTSTNIMFDIVVGLVVSAVVLEKKKKERMKLLGRGVGWILGGLAVASLWYGIDFWWHLATIPSVGGKSIVGAIGSLWRVIGQLLPLVLVVFGIDKLGKKLNKTFRWVGLWLGTFLLLTVWRMLADADFWIDWSAWGIEISLGLAVLGGLRVDSRRKIGVVLGLVIVLVMGWMVVLDNKPMWFPRKSLKGSVEERVAGWLDEEYQGCLEEKGKCGRVFVSGTPVFWLNALASEVPQVRGGRESGAIRLEWREGMYVLRENEDEEKVSEWIDNLGVEWILVHTDESFEPYHDFTQPQVYESMERLRLVKTRYGDRLYRVKDLVLIEGVEDDDKAWMYRLAGFGFLALVIYYTGFERLPDKISKKLSLA